MEETSKQPASTRGNRQPLSCPPSTCRSLPEAQRTRHNANALARTPQRWSDEQARARAERRERGKELRVQTAKPMGDNQDGDTGAPEERAADTQAYVELLLIVFGSIGSKACIRRVNFAPKHLREVEIYGHTPQLAVGGAPRSDGEGLRQSFALVVELHLSEAAHTQTLRTRTWEPSSAPTALGTGTTDRHHAQSIIQQSSPRGRQHARQRGRAERAPWPGVAGHLWICRAVPPKVATQW